MHLNLDDLINYKNSKLVSRYTTDYPQATMQGEEALTELMKYIWLCCKYKLDKKNNPHHKALDFSCVIYAEMMDIDNMWHTFLLFTKDYHLFCTNYLNGEFFHHDPLAEEDSISAEEYQTELSLYLSYIYDNLGENTLIKWFGNNWETL